MSAPHRNRMPGRPVTAYGMNILTFDIEDVAEAIKLRMLSRGGCWDVHVDPHGGVRMENDLRPHRSNPLPDAWLVGTYTSKARCALIEEDLVERLRELRPVRKSA
ncbi:hypothetical protein D3C81_170090 [compost metagenome]